MLNWSDIAAQTAADDSDIEILSQNCSMGVCCRDMAFSGSTDSDVEVSSLTGSDMVLFV